MRVFLIGLPGVGKSTLGPPLADALCLPFADLDALLAQRHHQTSADQIQYVGQPAFRWREAAELRRWITQCANGVLACGGGTPVYFGNLYILLAAGLVVWLDLDVDAWLNRIGESSDRPMLAGANGRVDRHQALEIRNRRTFAYQQAHLRLDAGKASPVSDWLIRSAQEVKRAADQMQNQAN